MRVLAGLFKSSRAPFFLALLAATASGAANAVILALINQILTGSGKSASGWTVVGAFAALCVLVPLIRFGSSYLLLRLSQRAIFDLRLELCRRILSAPLQRLEEVGAHRLMAALTGDVGSVATALADLPLLCMNLTVVAGSLVYLGWMSWKVLLAVLVFMVAGIASYQLPLRWGAARQQLARQEGDALFHHFQAVTEGTKELKLHRPRRREFLTRLASSADRFQKLNLSAQKIFAASASLAQGFVFIAVGFVILVVPNLMAATREVVTGYALVLLYLVTPLQAILDTLPTLSQARVAIGKVEELGLSLTGEAPDTEASPATVDAAPSWQQIRIAGVLHSYAAESEERRFSLGPIDLELRPGELVFVIGGNGSGKTTLMKLIAGLYAPQEGEILLDGRAVTEQRREEYRQMFSVVFSDFYLFKDLLGLDHPELDARARTYLEQLELDRKVKVEDGRLSTTDLSQGQRKRLALLTAYLENRSIYLLDEWAADQDPVYKEVFYRQILPGLRGRGKTVVVICHDDRYFHVADRLVKLENGRVVLDEQAAGRPDPEVGAPNF